MDIEIRGIYYKAVKNVFPGVAAIIGAELGKRFDDIDAVGWYDGTAYFETVKYLRDHISPQSMVLIGNEIIAEFRKLLPLLETAGPRVLAQNVPEFYANLVRGPGAGAWRVESYEPGRAILAENGATTSPALALGMIRAILESCGAYNVRAEVLNERAAGASENRYLFEWIHPSGE